MPERALRLPHEYAARLLRRTGRRSPAGPLPSFVPADPSTVVVL